MASHVMVFMVRCILLASGRKTVLVLTPDYVASAWTEFENLMLQTIDPANRALRLIPLLLKPCELPLRINYLTHVNFAAEDAQDLDLAWKRLYEVLNNLFSTIRMLRPDIKNV